MSFKTISTTADVFNAIEDTIRKIDIFDRTKKEDPKDSV